MSQSAQDGIYISDANESCTAESALDCVASCGGLFDERSSTTWSENSDQNSSTYPTGNNYSIRGYLFGTDTVQLNTLFSLKDITLSVRRNYFNVMQIVGLSRNSTLLDTLLSARSIASKTWSMFWGLTGGDATSQMDGTLIFGGYDAAKAGGANITIPLSDPHARSVYDNPCGSSLVVNVTGITMNLTNGSSKDILGSTPLQMCIDASYPLITLPGEVWTNWVSVDLSPPINRSTDWGWLYAADRV